MGVLPADKLDGSCCEAATQNSEYVIIRLIICLHSSYVDKGTWQYMSVHSLNDPFRRIVIQDELEAFFHVLLYYAVRFLYHNLSRENVGYFLYNYFDDYSIHASGHRSGRTKLHAIETGRISLRSYNNDDKHNLVLRFR